MSVKDRVKEDLYARKPWGEIYKGYRSKSQIYEGLTEWFGEREDYIAAMQGEAAKLEADVRDLTLKVQAGSTEHAELLKKNEDLREELKQNKQQLAEGAQRLETVEGQVREGEAHLNELNSKIDELASSGVTLETVQKIRAAEFESGEDLLGRVRTTQDHARLQRAVGELNVRKTELEKTVKGLEDTVMDLRERVKSAENRLDSLKDETAIYSTAVDVVKKLFRAGYGTKDIAHLRDGLKTMGIKGDPQASLKRLVKGLEKVKSLETLRRQVKEAEGELKATRRDLSAARAELKSMRGTTLKTVSETREAAVTELEKTGDEVTAEMRRVLAELREDVKGWGEIQRKAGELHSDIENAKRLHACMHHE